MLCKVAGTEGSRWNDVSLTLRSNLVLDGGQSAIHLLLLGLDGSRGGHYCRCCQECAARCIYGCLAVLCDLLLLVACHLFSVADSSLLAASDAVHAGHTAAVVDAVFLTVDAGSLAIACTQTATVALAGVDNWLQP